MKKIKQLVLPGFKVMIFSLLLLMLLPERKVSAATAVEIGTINYETLTIQVYDNGNSTVYYSLDADTWYEVEGEYISASKSYYLMDISWVSTSSDVALYFKGNSTNTVKSVVLPKRDTSLKVTYNKADEDLNFTNADEYDYFEWRKSSDYTWHTVSLDKDSSSYRAFLSSIEDFKMKGAKIIIRIPQVEGSGSNGGSRPSNEVTVTIAARASAPSISVNASKLTLNTTAAMEYYNKYTGKWLECTKTMSLSDIAPETLYANGAKTVTLMIRKAATANASYSKTAYITVTGQPAAPEIGGIDKDVSYYYENNKLVMRFNKASSSNIYEYAIVKANSTLNLSTAKWTSVSSTKLIKLSKTTAPAGCMIYVRKKGTNANATKGIELVLSSLLFFLL